MQPPRDDFPQLILQIIDAHRETGISFFELQQTSACWPDRLAQIVHSLKDAHLIEARPDGKLYPRTRRRKAAPVAPTFWARLLAVFAP